MQNSVELLAPCGCEQNFYGAINYGANAIYLGLSDFSARKNAGNFTLDKLKYYVCYAHMFNVKVYVAVNTVIKNGELNKYFKTIGEAYKCGIDAFIVQDLFLGRTLKKLFPGINLHLSTQAGINNLEGAKQAVSYGFSRVILARETQISEIKQIAQFVETEVFIHGALCTCFSGHCYFSSFIGGMSGNRGACRQPCRKLYKYQGKNIHDDYRYALSLSDLCLSSRLQELIDAGVKSFKIEGRMRSFEYLCAACDFYRELIDTQNISRTKFENLKRTYNRGGYTEGLAWGQRKNFISDKIQNHAGSVIARVSQIKGNELVLSSLKHKIVVGDCFKIITNGFETGSAIATLKNGKISVVFKQKAFVGSELAITKDASLEQKYRESKKLFRVNAILDAEIGKKLCLTVNGQEYFSEYEPTEAISSPCTKSEIKENLRKVDKYPFEVYASCNLNGSLFIPKKVMNELRARAYGEYFNTFTYLDKTQKVADNNCDFDINYEDNSIANSRGITVIGQDFSFKKFKGITNVIFCPEDYSDQKQFERFFSQTSALTCEKYLYLPPFITANDEKIIANVVGNFDGVYGESASCLFLANRYKKKFFGGIELNVTNNLSYDALVEAGASEVCLSKELNIKELQSMKDGWTLTYGDIKIMSLIYCPFSKRCGDCSASSLFTLCDSDGRKFKVRRFKLSSCRFEVYNEAKLKSKFDFNKKIFDFTTLSGKEIDNLIDDYFNNTNNNSNNFTSGNLVKGVI